MLPINKEIALIVASIALTVAIGMDILIMAVVTWLKKYIL